MNLHAKVGFLNFTQHDTTKVAIFYAWLSKFLHIILDKN